MDESPVAAAPDFSGTFLPHRDAAYNLARWIMRNDHDAEDCVQDGYLRAYRAFPRFRGGDGRTWLLAIVRNACYSRLRQTRREEGDAPFDETVHAAAADTPTGEAPWRQAMAQEFLPQALGQLPAEAREIIVLHEIEELPYKEIAVVMDIPLGTVMSRLSRARLKLQTVLQELLRKDLAHEL